MTKAQIKKLEKLAAQMEKLTGEFNRLFQETDRFDHSSNATFAQSRVNDANHILQTIKNEVI